MEHDRPTIRSLTPTLCSLFRVAPPALCDVPALEDALQAARETFGPGRAERCLVHAVDAVGDQLGNRFPELLAPVAREAPIRIPLRSVFPSMTPVCYASMFTGAQPERHGIRRYEKPVLACDTLFDAFLRSGLRVAIVAVADSSIERIFRDRDMDYFSVKYDPWVTDRAVKLMAEDRHELIVAYHQEYDDVMHGTTPFHPRALRGAENSVFAFSQMAGEMHRHWRGHNRVLVFAPDHGTHLDESTGRGTHGSDLSEDMDLCHYYGLAPGAAQIAPGAAPSAPGDV